MREDVRKGVIKGLSVDRYFIADGNAPIKLDLKAYYRRKAQQAEKRERELENEATDLDTAAGGFSPEFRGLMDRAQRWGQVAKMYYRKAKSGGGFGEVETALYFDDDDKSKELGWGVGAGGAGVAAHDIYQERLERWDRQKKAGIGAFKRIRSFITPDDADLTPGYDPLEEREKKRKKIRKVSDS